MNRLKAILATLLFAFVVVGCSSVERNIEMSKRGVVVVFAEKTLQGVQGSGLGTGFFIADNIIVTNNHVIADSTKIEIAMDTNGKTYEAEVVNTDSFSDVAVIKVKNWEQFEKENHYKTLRFSTDYTTLDTVYSIGHPWGLFWSVSKGIVSNELMHKGPGPIFFIQTDAHVFNGNSGGPLLNDNGDVVGVNSMMVSNEGGSYGLAIPSRFVEKVLSDFQKYGEVRWPVIGVALEGTTIKEVTENQPAAKAGLKVGDRIVSIWIENRTNFMVDSSAAAIFAVVVGDYQNPLKIVIERDDVLIPIFVTPEYKKSSDFPAR